MIADFTNIFDIASQVSNVNAFIKNSFAITSSAVSGVAQLKVGTAEANLINCKTFTNLESVIADDGYDLTSLQTAGFAITATTIYHNGAVVLDTTI